MSSFKQQSRDSGSRATSDGYSRAKGNSDTLQPRNSTPQVAAQQILQEKLNQSPRVQAQIQLQQMFNQSPRVAALAKLAEAMNSPDDARQGQHPVQRQEMPLDEELTQRQASKEEPLQGKLALLQREEMPGPEDEETLQANPETAQRKENRTGLPDNLKAGIENLSGLPMDDVKVHYHSSQPATMQALAYTKGTDIHVGPGQERHLAHEAWHVVQQQQGRVRPTIQAEGVSINSDEGLEQEADVMGARALQTQRAEQASAGAAHQRATSLPPSVEARESPIVGVSTVEADSRQGVIQGQWEESLYYLLAGAGTLAATVGPYLAYHWWPHGWSLTQLRNLYQYVNLSDLLKFAYLPWTPANVLTLAQGYAGANPNHFTAAEWLNIASAVPVNAAADATTFASTPGWNSASVIALAQQYVGANPNNFTAADWVNIASALPVNAVADAATFAATTPGWNAGQIVQLIADYLAYPPGPTIAEWTGIAAQVGPAARLIIPTILAANPALNPVQIARAAQIYQNSHNNVLNVVAWINRGARAQAPHMAPIPGPLAGAHAVPYALDGVLGPGAHVQMRTIIGHNNRPYKSNPDIRQHADALIAAGMTAPNARILLADFCTNIATTADLDQAATIAQILAQNPVPFVQIRNFFLNHLATAVNPLFQPAIRELAPRPGVTAALLNSILTTLQPLGNPGMVNLLSTQLANTPGLTLARLDARLNYFTQPAGPAGLGLAPGNIVANQFQALDQSLNQRVANGTMSGNARNWIRNAYKLIADANWAGMSAFLNAVAANATFNNPQATNAAYWLYLFARYHAGASPGGFADQPVVVHAGGAPRTIVINNAIINHVQERHTYEHYRLIPAIIGRHLTSSLFHPPSNAAHIAQGITQILTSPVFLAAYPWPLGVDIPVGAVQLRLMQMVDGTYRLTQYFIAHAPGLAHDVTGGVLTSISVNFPSLVY